MAAILTDFLATLGFYLFCFFGIFEPTGMVELINADPQTPEERHQVFVLKKRVVDTVLEEARIDQSREIHIKFRSDFTTRTNFSIS
jgi:hypothetical protein